jgi:hypothetical protein
MRLAGAFFANRAEVVDDMLNVEGGFWATTAVPARAAGFQCSCVVLCDTRRREVGTEYTLHIDAAGPTGQRWAPAWSTQFQLPGAMKFMVLTQIALPMSKPTAGDTSTASRWKEATSDSTFRCISSSDDSSGCREIPSRKTFIDHWPPVRLREGQPVMTT